MNDFKKEDLKLLVVTLLCLSAVLISLQVRQSYAADTHQANYSTRNSTHWVLPPVRQGENLPRNQDPATIGIAQPPINIQVKEEEGTTRKISQTSKEKENNGFTIQ